MHEEILVHVRQCFRFQNDIGRENAIGVLEIGHSVAEDFLHLTAIIYKSHSDSRMHIRNHPVCGKMQDFLSAGLHRIHA